MSVSLIYRGNCEWEPSSLPIPRDPPKELPTTTEPWMGRQDKLAAFLAAWPIGKPYLGGFIIDRDPRDNSPFPGAAEVTFTIARPPDFLAYSVANGRSIKTASISTTVASSSIIPGETSVDAVREVGFYAPESRYSYFASTMPDGERYDSLAITAGIRIIRSVIRASAGGKERVYGGSNAPAALVSALYMGPITRVAHESSPIEGTPWYRCTDTVSLELEGD
jgi:hypothetical protein